MSNVKKCEYRHDWVAVAEGYTQAPDGYICRVCNYAPKRDSRPWNEAESVLKLRETLKPGDTVYTILRSVSRSGMNRRISLCVGRGADVKDITWDAAHAMNDPIKNRAGYVQDVGISVGGCGMDMGFHLVYNLSRILFPNGFVCSGETCPSNDHCNDPECHYTTFTGKMHTGDGGYALNQRWL